MPIVCSRSRGHPWASTRQCLTCGPGVIWTRIGVSLTAKHLIRVPGCYCCVTMSQTPATTTSSSSGPNFRTIFVAALKEYEKKTKTDLHTHPLAIQLQSCQSSGDILAVLHDKVNEFDQSRSHNQRLSSWLNPTINVLYAFSTTLGQGVGLVSLNWSTLSAASS